MKLFVEGENKEAAKTVKLRDRVIPVPLLPPVTGLDNGTLFDFPLGRGRVLDCTF